MKSFLSKLDKENLSDVIKLSTEKQPKLITEGRLAILSSSQRSADTYTTSNSKGSLFEYTPDQARSQIKL